MVGMETADLLSARGVTLHRRRSACAASRHGMARNNRMELIERVAARGTRIMTERERRSAPQARRSSSTGADGATTSLEIGDFLIVAIGPAPDQEASRQCEAAGVPFSVVGDAYKPGDFLSCLRDAWMVALSVDRRLRGSGSDRLPRHANARG